MDTQISSGAGIAAESFYVVAGVEVLFCHPV